MRTPCLGVHPGSGLKGEADVADRELSGPGWSNRGALGDLVGVRIETSRLILRAYCREDFPAVRELSADPRMWTYSERGPMRPDEAWSRLLRHLGHWTLAGFGLFAVEERMTGRFVGEAGCSDFRRELGKDFDPFPEISWAIAPDAQGQGYAVEAGTAALRWMAANRGDKTTVCLINRDNLSSLRVAETLGYQPFRTLVYRDYPAVLMRRAS